MVRELIETEQELGRDLNFVLEKYIKAIDAGGPKVPMCVRDNKDLIFGNFRKIAEFHNTWDTFSCLCAHDYSAGNIYSYSNFEFRSYDYLR